MAFHSFAFSHLFLHLYIDFDVHKSRGIQIGEALQMQIEVQRRLHEQLEVHNIRTLEIIIKGSS